MIWLSACMWLRNWYNVVHVSPLILHLLYYK